MTCEDEKYKQCSVSLSILSFFVYVLLKCTEVKGSNSQYYVIFQQLGLKQLCLNAQMKWNKILKILTLARLGLGQYETRRRPFPSFRQVTPRDVAVTNPPTKRKSCPQLKKSIRYFPRVYCDSGISNFTNFLWFGVPFSKIIYISKILKSKRLQRVAPS